MAADISVIIPVFNRQETLDRALKSIFSQGVPVSEIVVVDDGSTDGTAAVYEKYKDRIVVERFSENCGVSAARNAGIRRATHEWICLLDSDDEWLPDKIRNQLEYIERHPDCTIFQSEEIWIRNGVRVNPMKKHRKYGGDIFLQSLPLCIVSPSAVMFRKSVFLELGEFDTAFPVCEDYDLWLRWSLRYPVGLDERPGIIKYGGHEDQLSRRYHSMDRYRILSLNKCLASPYLDSQREGAVRNELNKKLKIYLGGLQKRGRHDNPIEDVARCLEVGDDSRTA